MKAGTIVVLGTGGTIAGTAQSPADQLGYHAAQLGVEQILEAVPLLEARSVIAEQVAQVDSKDMTTSLWRELALRCAHWLAQPDVRALVVTHGTDTVEETAFFLHTVLAPAKPVVLTCAMRPATALAPDGPQNVADALAVADCPSAGGVTVVCAGTIHGALDVNKVHPLRLDAFDSGDAGPVGHVQAGQLRISREWPRADGVRADLLLERLGQPDLAWPSVQIVLSHAGADGSVVDALVGCGVRGLVVAGTGNGTLHRALEESLTRARAAGVRVLRSTRCLAGQALAQPNERFPLSPFSPVKARIDLMLDLLLAA